MNIPWVSLACKKCSATQRTWIVAQTVSSHCPKMLGALREPATVLKKYTALTVKAIGGESRWMAVEIIINKTPMIIISVHTCVFQSTIHIITGRTERYFSQILKHDVLIGIGANTATQMPSGCDMRSTSATDAERASCQLHGVWPLSPRLGHN